MISKKRWNLDSTNIDTVSEEIRQELTGTKADSKEITNGLLLLEELSMRVFANDETKKLDVRIVKRLSEIRLQISYKSQSYNPLEETENWQEDESDYYRWIIIRANKDKLGYVYKNRQNILGIQLHNSSSKRVYVTLLSMLAGIICGLLLKQLAGEEISQTIATNGLDIVKTMFLNALKMMIAPVVFFSIAVSISGLTNLSDFGRMGSKIFVTYMITTVIAIAMGTGIGLLSSQNISRQSATDSVVAKTDTIDVSIPKMICNIVPKNMVSPIVESDMLQIIFIAVICGIAISLLGEKVSLIASFFEQMNTLSLKIVMILVRFVPIASFCAMASLMINMGIDSLTVVLRIVIGVLVCSVGMLLVYTLIVMVYGRLKPAPFVKKILGFMVTPFSLGSSNAAMPFSMEFCTNKMGISTKLSSFSIPIGATVNMDGTSTYLALSCIVFMRMYGMRIDASVLLTLFLSVFLLSIGAPGVPGSGMICLSTIAATLGLPLECVGMIIGIDQLMGMIRATFNVTGDVAVTTAVAKREKLLDENMYYKMM